ncbi:hypothetical protein NYP18_08930 [Corynebacterium sp. YIM 101645]|uniref:Uncharacterized protein n=1 Tax=Corynebacterium lemuris TaxID=1859292 RepID=A0ABT2G0G1_9CORY|nr:hypothetical protein [Corynebacterium lemuris]MCS5479782.1 hypothetical protein [Corynebacterium lemuris]
MARNKELMTNDFLEHVDDQLDRHRAKIQRYSPGAPWLNDVVDDIDSSHISDDELRRLYVSEIVRRREGEATRGVTNMARKMAKTGQMPIDWFEYADRPIAYTVEVPDEEGKMRKQEIRVTLRAATGEDFLAWARWREKKANETRDVEMQTVNVFRGWAHEMELGGFRYFPDYATAITQADEDHPAVVHVH